MRHFFFLLMTFVFFLLMTFLLFFLLSSSYDQFNRLKRFIPVLAFLGVMLIDIFLPPRKRS